MKNLFFIGSLVLVLGLLFSFNALAIEQSQQSIATINDCVDVKVELLNATQIVSPGEYSFKDCTYNTYWSCSCNGHYDLTLITQINTINKYNFRINYTTKQYTQRNGGGGSGGSFLTNITNTINLTNVTPLTTPNVSVPIKPAPQINTCPPEKTCPTCQPPTTCNETQEPITPPLNHGWRTTAIITIGIGILLSLYIMYKSGVFL